MRVISGKLGGRKFDAPKGRRTHPASDKLRGGLFNALGDIEGLTLLDAFAGSGAISFEAASRGAEAVTAIEISNYAHKIIQKNIQDLGVVNCVKAIRANASGWSDNNPDKRFDIVILEPPYDNLRLDMLVKIANHARSGGIVVLSLPPTLEFLLPSTGFHLLSSKSYGDATLAFYRKVS